MNRAEKQEEVEFLKECYQKSQIALCGDYRGLTVAQMSKLRRELRTAGAKAFVVRNTLARLSAKDVLKAKKAEEFEKFLATIKGPSLVIFAEADPVAPAKVLAKFMKDNDKLKMKGAWFESSFLDASGVDSLSKMPGKAETLASLLRVIMAPATQLARIIQAPGEQVVRVIEAHRKNLESKAAA